MQWWQQDEAIQPSYRALLWGGWRPAWNGSTFCYKCIWESGYKLACTDVVPMYPMQFPALTVPQGEAVYDFCWYPKMNSWEPETCWWATLQSCAVVSPSCFHSLMHTCIPHSFVTSCKDHPVHLWDAFYYHRRASYVPHNHLVRTCCLILHSTGNQYFSKVLMSTFTYVQILKAAIAYIIYTSISGASIPTVWRDLTTM